MRFPESILHHSNHVLTRGGMESIIGFHLRHAANGDHAVSFRDVSKHGNKAVTALGIAPRTLLGELRRRYREAVRGRKPDLSIYHNCWASELVHDLDPAPLKIGFLHSDFPGFDRVVRHHAPFLDGFININPALHERCRRLLPGWEPGRFIELHYPVDWPEGIETLATRPRNECVIGISGRIKRAQKRLDRLPRFLAECDKALGDYPVEILGSGDYEAVLRRKLGNRGNVRFLGWREGAAYWETLARWRYVVFLSDYEGTSISLLEAAGAGVLPVYPDFHPGQPAPAGLSPDHLYASGNVQAAAAGLAALEAGYPARFGRFAESARELRKRHSPHAYMDSFSRQLEDFPSTPPPHVVPAPAPLPRWLTLTFYNWRMKALRFGPSGVFRHR